MKFSLKTMTLLLGSAGLFAAAPAYAGCGDGAALKPSVWQGDANSLFQLADAGPSIVGLWSTQFFAGGNMVDFGYAQWHSDGTEILNSGARAPSTQNFCLGVWARVNENRYKLNHFALSYDTSGTLNGIANIREDVIVTGDTYGGPFTLDIYDPRTRALLQHIAGHVTGKRVTINTGI